nr:unnamed protein product [Digitaria exilis]
MDLWNGWETQILVLVSLGWQVFLLLLAGIRRQEGQRGRKVFLWLVYQFADSTAIYTIGHLALTGAAEQRQLIAFWAPFLLLHLGGPDNITAYSLQDNELWLRHLQTLIIQVLGVGYVLYNNIAGNNLIILAAILMSVVGDVKYAERTHALRCSNLQNIRSSLKRLIAKHHQLHILDQKFDEEARDEFYVRRAHYLFYVCKHAIVDSWIEQDPENEKSIEMLKNLSKEDYKEVWTLMEMELSLMYDLLYTKAGVIHTWQGYCIRVLSPLVVSASIPVDRTRVKLDICLPLRYKMLGFKEWWIRYYYSNTKDIPDYLKQKIFNYIHGLGGDGPDKERWLNAQGLIRKKWGLEALRRGLDNETFYKENKDEITKYFGVEFQECIIVWHIGTDVSLDRSSGVVDAADAADLVNAIRMLSNYLFFLLVDRPYMLPGLAQTTLYRRTRENLENMWKENSESHPDESIYIKLKKLFSLHDEANLTEWKHRVELATILDDKKPDYSDEVPRLYYAIKVTKLLRNIEQQKGSKATLDVLLNVWIDLLVHAANRCSRESHAKKLSDGGELITILWLMTNYLHQGDYALEPKDV